MVRHCARGHAVVVMRPAAPCPVIALDERWSEPGKNLSTRRRGDLNRARRRAEELGKVGIDILSPCPQETDALLEEAFRIEASGWKGKEGTALACDPRRAEFFRIFSRAAAGEGILRICFLRINDQRVAMQVAAQCGGAFWLLKIGHDESFARCSPGLLLLEGTIRQAVKENLRSYEFLGSVAPWTEVWTQQTRQCVSIRIYPLNARGMGALACESAQRVMRKWSKP
jgi:CelD/BcsL family acetyltransferase involved in cellulose biosynthesis